MSCGEPHETDCSEVLEVVYSFLDGEIDESGKARIRQHLDECGPCLRQFGIEREVKVLVARCCGADQKRPAIHGAGGRVVVRPTTRTGLLRAGRKFAIAAAIAAMCFGLVPQHPPIKRAPSATISRADCAKSSGAVG